MGAHRRKFKVSQAFKTTATESFGVFFRQGTALLHRGEAAEAIVLLERAHHLQPEHSDAALNLAAAYILAGKFKRAVPILEALSEAAPENVMVWTNLGAAYLGNPILAGEEERARAIAAFERAIELNPAAPNVAYNLGLIYRDRKDREKAIYWFECALQANPLDGDARKILEQLTNSDSDENSPGR